MREPSARKIAAMRVAYVEQAKSVQDLVTEFLVPAEMVRQLIDRGDWDAQRLAHLGTLVEQAAAADDAEAHVALLRRTALIVAGRIIRKGGELVASDCTAHDVRAVATALEAADRVARRELGLAVERSEHDVAVGQRKERDMWAVIASVPQDGGGHDAGSA